MAKLLIFLFCGLLSVTGCTVKPEKPEQDNASASLIASGTTGELTWELGEDGTLTISGKGEMLDYWYSSLSGETFFAPWFEYRNDISSVFIGDGVTNIGSNAFYYCSNMSSVNIPNSVTMIGSHSFDYCTDLMSVHIPNSVISIGSGAFRGCSGLTSVIIPNSVTSIGGNAFGGLSDLTSVTIGNSVTFIEVFAFRQCVGLTEIINYQEIPQDIHFTVFVQVDQNNCTLLVPAGSIDAYRNAEVWKDFVNIKEIQ